MKSSAYWMVALVMAVATVAHADESEKVTLRDGSVFGGEIVEKIPGDHITLKLATGEINRIEWAELADATERNVTGTTHSDRRRPCATLCVHPERLRL